MYRYSYTSSGFLGGILRSDPQADKYVEE